MPTLANLRLISTLGAAGIALLSMGIADGLSAQTAKQGREIRDRINKMTSGGFGCTASKKEMRRLSRQYPAYHFAFAGRKAPTITGIRGCGMGWNVDKARAQAVAMKNCKRWEAEFGTNGGTRTCRFQK